MVFEPTSVVVDIDMDESVEQSTTGKKSLHTIAVFPNVMGIQDTTKICISIAFPVVPRTKS